VGGGNRQRKGLPGRAKHGGELYSLGRYGNHDGLLDLPQNVPANRDPGEAD